MKTTINNPRSISLLAAGLALCGIQAQAQELLVDGGFENDTLTYEVGSFNPGDVTGWAYENQQFFPFHFGTFSVTSGASGPFSGAPTVGPASGSYYAIADGFGPFTSALGQTFTVAPGSHVNLSFEMFDNDHSGVAAQAMQHVEVDILQAGDAFLTGTVLDQLYYGPPSGAGPGPNPYQNYSFDLTSLVGGGGNFEVVFADYSFIGGLNQMVPA